jgi:large subunit ribosomal protein L30
MTTKIAIIRIRGTDDVNGQIEATMKMLKLHKKHVCSVYPKTDSIMGMLERCKDYVTYGELDEETYKLLVDKRAVTKEGKVQNYFHLAPPRGGFERRGIKAPYTMKGALGYRKEKINLLIKKMI